MVRLVSLAMFFLLLRASLVPVQPAMAQLPATQLRSTAGSIVAATAPGRFVVVYRNGRVPANPDALIRSTGATPLRHMGRLGLSSVAAPAEQAAAIAARLASRPEVAAVLQDRVVRAQGMPIRPAGASGGGQSLPAAVPSGSAPRAAIVSSPDPAPVSSTRPAPSLHNSIGDGSVPLPSQGSGPSSSTSSTPTTPANPAPPTPPTPVTPTDAAYDSPQGWAVRQAGGYGDGVPGGPAAGPWNTSLGAGMRIAVIDSGVDASHPDIAPNLVYQKSFIDQTASGEPSPCDDGSAQDQSGHGTWVASLATGAMGAGTGNVIGVAPQASLLSIKVLERLPAATGATTLAQCEAGQPGGLLSWVLEGIDDAVEQRADVIVVSLGSVVDLTTGDGAGWKAQFDSATYAAQQAGAVIVGAVGNDGLNLGGGQYVELPAQARGVLPVVADTNAACAENLASGATCAAGPITRAYYSNYGAAGAVAAPGGSLPEGPDSGVSGFVYGACSSGLSGTSDGLPGTDGQSLGCFGLGHVAYVQAMGTSASAPLTAGAVAILRAARPTLTAAQVVALVQSTATQGPGMAEPQLNLAAALAAQ